MVRALTALSLTGLLLATGCFSPNPFAVMNAGPHISSVVPPTAPVDGQPSHWTVSWTGGEAPYTLVFTAFADVAVGSPDDSVTYTQSNISTPYSFDVTLPTLNPGEGHHVDWRVEIRDTHWSAGSGFGNPFLPSYIPMDSEEGTLPIQSP